MDNVINKRILELCQQRKWTEYKLAKESHIPNSSINAMFKHNHTPSFHTLQKICDAFQISMSYFFNSNLFEQTNLPLYERLWNELSVSDREKVLVYMYGLLHKEIKDGEFLNDI